MESDILSSDNWNFEKVPDNELVACCYWEYARESAFIRDVRQRCIQNWRSGGHWEQRLHADLQKVQNIGYSSEVFMRGFFFEPDVKYQNMDKGLSNYRHPSAPMLTGSFPEPWQSLSRDERCERSRIRNDRAVIPLVPIKRGGWHDAADIARWAEGRWQMLHAEFQKVRRENPETSEVDLVAQGKLKPFPDIQPSLYWAGGSEITVLTINWPDFTNDELVQYFRHWVKVNRPKQVKKPDARGHKPGDWRANLTRLAVMRLLSQFSALQIVRQDSFPAVWKTKQFSGRKWGDFTKWRDARREAGKLFRTLFPFLPVNDKPLSWERQSPGNCHGV